MGEEDQRGSVTFPGSANHNTRKRKGAPEEDKVHEEKSRPGNPVVWACPFYKNDPVKYKECRDHKLLRNADITQHINRRHLQPIHCPTCGEIFTGDDSDSKKNDHIVQRICEKRPFHHAGATPAQVILLKGKLDANVPKATTPDARKWYGRYAILFGDTAPRPPSPYRSVREGDIGKQTCELIGRYIKEGRPGQLAQRMATSDLALPAHFHQLLADLQLYALEPPQQQDTGAIASTPATVPDSLEQRQPPAPLATNASQHSLTFPPNIGLFHYGNPAPGPPAAFPDLWPLDNRVSAVNSAGPFGDAPVEEQLDPWFSGIAPLINSDQP